MNKIIKRFMLLNMLLNFEEFLILILRIKVISNKSMRVKKFGYFESLDV